MSGLDALHGKNHYIQQKNYDQNMLTDIQRNLAQEQRRNTVQSQVHEYDFKSCYNTLVQGYESELNQLRTDLSTCTDQTTRENLQQKINQIQTEKAIALAQLQDEKDAATQMITQAKDQQETYWTKLKGDKESDLEMDKNMITYFDKMWKDFCAAITGGNSSSQSKS